MSAKVNAYALAMLYTREPDDTSRDEVVRHVAAADCVTSMFVTVIGREIRS